MKKEVVGFKMDPDMLKMLKAKAKREGITFSEAMRRAVVVYLGRL